jgi:hypothetical protein
MRNTKSDRSDNIIAQIAHKPLWGSSRYFRKESIFQSLLNYQINQELCQVQLIKYVVDTYIANNITTSTIRINKSKREPGISSPSFGCYFSNLKSKQENKKPKSHVCVAFYFIWSRKIPSRSIPSMLHPTMYIFELHFWAPCPY